VFVVRATKYGMIKPSANWHD